jgi:hypothetical protein
MWLRDQAVGVSSAAATQSLLRSGSLHLRPCDDDPEQVACPVIDEFDVRPSPQGAQQAAPQAVGQELCGKGRQDRVAHIGVARLDVLHGQIVWQMAGADDLDPVCKHQHTDRSADEVVAVNEGVGDQFLPDEAWDLRQALGVEALLALRGAGVGSNEAQRLLEDVGQLAGDVSTVDLPLVLDRVADEGHRLDDKGRKCVLRRLRK